MRLVVLILVLLLSACATDPVTVKTLVDAQQAANARPTLALMCPAGGCALEYTDPRDRAQIKMPTNGWDAVMSVGNNVTSLVPIIVTGRIATAGFDALKGSGGTQTTTTTTVGATTSTGAVTTTTTGDTLSGTGALGSGQYWTQANPVTTTSTANPVTTTSTTVTPAPVIVTPVITP